MGRWRFRAALVVAMLSGSAMSACGDAAARVSSPTPTGVVAAPSTNSPAGALTGFLRAAGAQDNTLVPAWLATSTDATSLADLLSVYSGYAAGRGIFWAVAGVRVTGVTTVDATHADVMLSGPVVWCLGMAADDPAATCNLVTGVSGAQDTYAAASVDGTWKADIDINASSGLDHNPQASPAPRAATPSPT
jgi:hypothetical protein